MEGLMPSLSGTLVYTRQGKDGAKPRPAPSFFIDSFQSPSLKGKDSTLQRHPSRQNTKLTL